ETHLSNLLNYISKIPDYRQQCKIDYKLTDSLLLMFCAVIGRTEGWGNV
ncbi:transposase family protein, partial [Salmonella enterica]|nr:ISAs1 family transposase [Salmonella enterica]EEJ0066400.1 transposase family protein [Salmonella enterica]EJO4130816.1 transposase family protein [Salmonella enterica]